MCTPQSKCACQPRCSTWNQNAVVPVAGARGSAKKASRPNEASAGRAGPASRAGARPRAARRCRGRRRSRPGPAARRCTVPRGGRPAATGGTQGQQQRRRSARRRAARSRACRTSSRPGTAVQHNGAVGHPPAGHPGGQRPDAPARTPPRRPPRRPGPEVVGVVAEEQDSRPPMTRAGTTGKRRPSRTGDGVAGGACGGPGVAVLGDAQVDAGVLKPVVPRGPWRWS